MSNIKVSVQIDRQEKKPEWIKLGDAGPGLWEDMHGCRYLIIGRYAGTCFFIGKFKYFPAIISNKCLHFGVGGLSGDCFYERVVPDTRVRRVTEPATITIHVPGVYE